MMIRLACILMLCCIAATSFGQRQNIIGKNLPVQVSYYAMPDKGYPFHKILNDDSLHFIKADYLRLDSQRVFWLKIIIGNPHHLALSYNIELSPDFNNTYYYFDANLQKWSSKTVGYIPPPGYTPAEGGATNIIMHPNGDNIVFVRMDLSAVKNTPHAIKPQIRFEDQAKVDHRKSILLNGWVASVSVMFFFFLSNLYLYLSFRDRSVLYYLCTQVGGIIYLTAYREFFSYTTFACRLFNNGAAFEYDVNNVFEHTGILLAMYGVVQFTRSYLPTKKNLPRMDRLLKWGLYFYICCSLILLPLNMAGVLLEPYTLIPDNIYLFLLVSLILATACVAYKRKLRAAGVFLLAYSVTLCLIMAITVFHVAVTFDESSNWFGNMAMMAEAFTFSIALVARTKTIQNELQAKDLEAQQLGFELKEIGLRHNIIELENQKILSDIQHEKARNELLQQKLEANQRELASTTLYMVQKNELLATLKTEIAELNKIYPNSRYKGLAGVESILQSNLYLDEDWTRFKLHFEQVHPHFFEDLTVKYPALTNNEIRLYAYFHIKLSTKEIAALLNIEPASVRRAKTRLFKKMGRSDLLTVDGASEEE